MAHKPNEIIWVNRVTGVLWEGRPRRRLRGYLEIVFTIQSYGRHEYTIIGRIHPVRKWIADVVYFPVFTTIEAAKKYVAEWMAVTQGDVNVSRCKDHDDCLRSPKLGRACYIFQSQEAKRKQ